MKPQLSGFSVRVGLFIALLFGVGIGGDLEAGQPVLLENDLPNDFLQDPLAGRFWLRLGVVDRDLLPLRKGLIAWRSPVSVVEIRHSIQRVVDRCPNLCVLPGRVLEEGSWISSTETRSKVSISELSEVFEAVFCGPSENQGRNSKQYQRFKGLCDLLLPTKRSMWSIPVTRRRWVVLLSMLLETQSSLSEEERAVYLVLAEELSPSDPSMER